MPTLNGQLNDFVVGDDFSIRYTINFANSGFEAGTTITDAWFTVKQRASDLDGAAIFQKAVTTVDVADVGQIENTGSGDVDIVVRFDITPANSLAIGTTRKQFDFQVKTATGKIYTCERGKIWGHTQVTLAA